MVYLMCFLIYLSILYYLSLLLLSLYCVIWRSSAPKDFNETRSPIFAGIQRIGSDVSSFNLFLTLSSFWLSVSVQFFILNHVFFWDLKRLSALSSCIICHATLFFFFLLLLTFNSELVWVLRFSNCISSVLSCNFFLRFQNCFFNRLWSFNVFEFVWSCTHNVYWWSRDWFLVVGSRW